MKRISGLRTRTLAALALAAFWAALALAQEVPGSSGAQAPAKAARDTSGFPLLRGSAFVGLNINYNNTKKENVQSGLDNLAYSNEKSGNFIIDGGWFFKENAAVGLGLGFGGTTLSKEVTNAIGPPTLTESKTRVRAISPFIRYYLPMGSNHRYYLLTQLELTYAHESGDESETTGSSETLSSLTNNTYGLVFTPGLVIFVIRGFALEATIGVGGIKYSVEKRQQAGVPDGVIKTTDFDFRIDLLKLSLGIAYYF